MIPQIRSHRKEEKRDELNLTGKNSDKNNEDLELHQIDSRKRRNRLLRLAGSTCTLQSFWLLSL